MTSSSNSSDGSLTGSTASSGSDFDQDSFGSDSECLSDSVVHQVSDPEETKARPAGPDCDMNCKDNETLRIDAAVQDSVCWNAPIAFLESKAYLVNEAKKLKMKVPVIWQGDSGCFCLGRKNGLVCQSVWESLFKISKAAFDEKDVTHHRILNSLHGLITGISTAPSRFGDHWKVIGFQSADPVLELGPTGMLSLLLPLQFFSGYKKLSQNMVRISRLPGHEFPLMTVLIHFVGTTLDAAEKVTLLKHSDKEVDIWKDIGRFFAAMVQDVVDLCESHGYSFQHDSGALSVIQDKAKSSPVSAVKHGKRIERKEGSSTMDLIN
jgi:hypothetical protein